MVKPVLLSYTKPIKNRLLGTQIKVTGNAMLMVADDVVERFAIPIAHEFNLLVEREVQRYAYDRLHGQNIQVPPYRRLNPGTASSYNIARLYQYQPKTRPTEYLKKNHAIRFPYFFNKYMVLQAVASMLQHSNLPIHVQIDGRGGKQRLGYHSEWDDSHWGTAKVITTPAPTKNIDKVPWGELTVVQAVQAKPRQRLIKINKAPV
jgi:hypothetical protein